VSTVGLVFRRPFAERKTDGIAELELGFGAGGLAVREAFAAEVFDGRQDFLELLNAAADLFDQGSLRSSARMFGVACSGHGGVEKV
jgi:hypothetical protein